jgi:hypothetical protein
MHDPNCSFLVVFVFNLGLECLYWPSFLEEFFSEIRRPAPGAWPIGPGGGAPYS